MIKARAASWFGSVKLQRRRRSQRAIPFPPCVIGGDQDIWRQVVLHPNTVAVRLLGWIGQESFRPEWLNLFCLFNIAIVTSDLGSAFGRCSLLLTWKTKAKLCRQRDDFEMGKAQKNVVPDDCEFIERCSDI